MLIVTDIVYTQVNVVFLITTLYQVYKSKYSAMSAKESYTVNAVK